MDKSSKLTHRERVEYEERILTAEMEVSRIRRREAKLRRLIRQPEAGGGYIGDTFYPVGGTEASHRWNGDAWEWLL